MHQFVATLLPESESLLSDKTYYGPMLQGLNDSLLERGMIVRPVQCLQEYQKEHFLHASDSLYAGVVFLGLMYPSRLFIRAVCQHFKCPKVIMDHQIDDLPLHSVREDSAAGMRSVVEHLVSLGHRHIAYIDQSDPDANPWKREGVREGLLGAGLPELGRGWIAGCRDKFGDTSAALDWFLGLTPRPTAIVCCDDVRALLLLQAAAERGMRVPRDLSITGYGDFAVRAGRSQVLTSAHVDCRAMGRRAGELIVQPERDKSVILVSPELIVRGTTGGPATG
jgi:LacI family transcriptional regulator